MNERKKINNIIDLDKLIDGFTRLIELRFKIYELKAKEQIITVISKIAALTILLSFGLFMIFFLSIGLGFYLNSVLNSGHAGFLVVGGIYFFLGLLMILNRGRLITNPLFHAFFSETLIDPEDDEEDKD